MSNKIYRTFSIHFPTGCRTINRDFDNREAYENFVDPFYKDHRNGKIIGEFDNTPNELK